MRITALSIALLALACGAPEPAGDAGTDAGGRGRAPCSRDGGLDAGAADGLTNLCTEGLVLSGFGIRWDDGAHRVGRWAVYPRIGPEHFPDGCPPTSALRGASLVTELDGPPEVRGPSAPGAEAWVTYHVIGAGGGGALPPDAGTWTGLRIVRGSQTIELDAEPEGEAPVLFNLAAARMSSAPSITVVLDGLELETDVAQSSAYPPDYDPRDGYSVRGVGARIANVRREGDDLRFDVGARFALGRRDRPDMNRAIAVARTRVTVHFAVIASDRPPAGATIAYRETHRGHGERPLAVCRPDPSTTALAIEGAFAPRAAPALRSFVISLFPDAEDAGDDLRELSIRISRFDHDPASGRATMHVEGYASNEGPPPPALPMDYEVEAEVVLLQWDGTDPSEELSFVAPIEVGRTETPLPLTAR
ncbi:MAG TPA: hypothetical protein VIL20_20045 [Sandaracinaceae bacterium]